MDSWGADLYRVQGSLLRELVTGDSSISDGLPVAVKTSCGLEDDDDDDDRYK